MSVLLLDVASGDSRAKLLQDIGVQTNASGRMTSARRQRAISAFSPL
jgi:hypothetical protein